MITIIEWCNSNQGFTSAVLSALTLIFSGIAIFVSIQTAKLPFLKKLKLISGYAISELGYGVHVTIINVGNRPVTISMVGIMINRKQIIIPSQIGKSQKTLQPTEETKQYYSLDVLKKTILEQKFALSDDVYGYVEDTEGDIYKRKIGTVSDILKDR